MVWGTRRRAAALILVGSAVTGCGLIPGTSEAGLAGVPEYEDPTNTVVPVAPVGGDGGPTTTVEPLFPELNLPGQAVAAPSSTLPGETTLVAPTTTLPMWMGNADLRPCTAIIRFVESGQRVEASARDRVPPTEVVSRLSETVDAGYQMIQLMAPETDVKIRSVLDAASPLIGQMQAAGSDDEVVGLLQGFARDRRSQIDDLINSLGPECPGLITEKVAMQPEPFEG